MALRETTTAKPHSCTYCLSLESLWLCQWSSSRQHCYHIASHFGRVQVISRLLSVVVFYALQAELQ